MELSGFRKIEHGKFLNLKTNIVQLGEKNAGKSKGLLRRRKGPKDSFRAVRER
jgi:hypothetical protein